MIIPKDINLTEGFIVSNTANRNKCQFIANYNYAINNNNKVGRYLYIFKNGGLDEFNIVLLGTVECDKDEIEIYRNYYHQTIVNKFMQIHKNLTNHYH